MHSISIRRLLLLVSTLFLGGSVRADLPDILRGKEILYVVRAQYLSDHHNTATLFQTGEINTRKFRGGSALKALDPATGTTRVILASAGGLIRDPEVHPDGRRIVFSMRKSVEDDYHLYEIGADGQGLRQLTEGSELSDIDPLYLPDGRIAFTSSRDKKYCMCNRHIMANLFVLDPGTGDLDQIGRSTLFEGHATLLSDGRLLYDRWEYVDRNFGDAQGLWTVYPDGTGHALYWGNNVASPGGVIDARPVPGTGQILCVFGSCHDRPWGALALLDRGRGIDRREAIVQTWPATAVDLFGKGNWDTYKKVRPRYEDPYPLDPDQFLCARTLGDGEETGLYLIDTQGREELLHREAPGCFDPMLLTAQPAPPSLPERKVAAHEPATAYVLNVYEGTHLDQVAPGSIHALRVVESPPKRSWTHPSWNGQGQHAPAMNWHDFSSKRILGTVPVEADGSAYFELPADTFVFFQLLDEQGMMVQSMRSGTIARPGERLGCTGCHENRLSAPPPPLTGGMPLALQRAPSPLRQWHTLDRPLNYLADVQPVFDRYCVSCHDYGNKDGAIINLAGDRDLVFNTSYNELWRKGWLKVVGAGPAEVQQAYTWGSHASRLTDTLLKEHEGVRLDPVSLDRVLTWIDLNAPYYPSYDSAYPGNLAGRSPLTPGEVKQLQQWTGIDLVKQAGHNQNKGPQVCFDRPELSPCLAGLKERNPEHYAAAVALIETGRDRLAIHKRADDPGPAAEWVKARSAP